MSDNRTILICQCAGRGLLTKIEDASSPDHEQPVLIADLCKAAADKDPIFAKIAAAEQPVIYACHPRAVRSLFTHAGHPLPSNAEFINLRNTSGEISNTLSAQSDTAWFPVIDEDRCTACGQCYEFCLFGVYEKDDEGKVIVANPESCKNNCPACARICSETAIIFPKAGESPINGGEITDESERKANIRINVDEILGDDVYAALHARKQKRRTLLNRKKVEQALRERENCSEKKT